METGTNGNDGRPREFNNLSRLCEEKKKSTREALNTDEKADIGVNLKI
jgi:hypothetical protein